MISIASRPVFRRSHGRILSFLLLLPLAGLGCSGPKAAPPELPTPKVTVTEVLEKETTDYEEYVGRTEPSETVEVRSRVYGYLNSVGFRDGDPVTKDQEKPLFTIESDEYDAILKVAESKVAVWQTKLEVAQVKLARNEKLVKTNSISKEDYEESVAAVKEAEASVKSAKADVDRAAIDVKYTVITAPISGRIDRTLVTPGNLLTGGMANGTLLTRIVNVQPIYVYFDVDERSLLRYERTRKDGQEDKTRQPLRDREIPCYVQLADEKDFPHQGMLDFAENRIDSGTGTIKIRGVFTNEDQQLTAGMFVRVRVPVSKPYKALMIPERAIATDQNIKFTYVVGSDNIATRRDLVLGTARGTNRIVKSGVSPGERVIVKGLQRVRPDQKVELTLEKPASKAAAGENSPPADHGEKAASSKRS